MHLAGKTAIVTGASRGIGRAICRRLAGGGATVVAVARSADGLRETVAACAGSAGRCVAQPCDVSRLDDIRALVSRCEREFGRLDVLVNNAGVAPLGPIESMDDASFEQVLAVNIEAVFRLCRAGWPLLKQSSGVIVNISSVAATDPFPGFAVYGGTKAFVNTFTRALAAEGKQHGIRAFTIAPGAVDTQMLRAAFPDFPDQDMIQPDDIAAMVELLLDERCRYSTGQVIEVRR